MKKNNLSIAIPKGRIGSKVLPLIEKIGIKPDLSFYDENDRRLEFSTNYENIKLLRVRSFDVATFLIYGAAQIAIIGSDILEEFNHSEIYSPIDLKVGRCRMVLASKKEMINFDNPLEWSSIRVATKYPNITKKYFENKGIQAECIKLNGALELAPNLGLCKRIVDLVETGKTLSTNGLVEIEELTKVSTRLAINRMAYKTNFNQIKGIIDKFEDCLNDK